MAFLSVSKLDQFNDISFVCSSFYETEFNELVKSTLQIKRQFDSSGCTDTNFGLKSFPFAKTKMDHCLIHCAICHGHFLLKWTALVSGRRSRSSPPIIHFSE